MSIFDSMGTPEGMELGWEDEIQQDSQEFILLPEGDYVFEVTAFERAKYNGSEKVPPCNQAKLKLQVTTDEGTTTINHNLFLYSKFEGMLSAFFCAIGQKKHGERIKMNWNNVIGAKGKAKIGIHEYTNDKGELKKFNQVRKFYDASDNAPTQPQATFKAGSF
ncbi:DUF669 domain-containing protein [Anaerosinus massiliensis]|uniref:DUF669 domain-containing protein n=1 Tax=Massilibacillus massiliensis TaxID=1806837 RepID=UPI000DA61FA7|nr:DUF669 domain-containing protein [Massilibacillus massiliensis]